MREHAGELGAIAQRWFQVMRECGDDLAYIQASGFSEFARQAVDQVVHLLKNLTLSVDAVVDVGCGTGDSSFRGTVSITVAAGKDIQGVCLKPPT